ncbi:MAG TPA: hypothetical protein VHB68_17170 [Steroidobacteraceae bacterium]|nr:hypothetical protein [Steroidobacteraceae bacterium]
MRFRGRWVAKGAGILVLILAVVALLGFVVMSLWNALVPGLFHGPLLGFWQALGLLLLCRILFGGLRGRPGWHGRARWNREWRRRWESMTPEERERLRTRFKHRCGPWGLDEPSGESAPREPSPRA